MAAESKSRFQVWGPVGLSAAFLLAGVTFLLSPQPEHSDVVAFTTFGLGGIVLMGLAIFGIYKSYGALKDDLESIRHSYTALKGDVDSIHDYVKAVGVADRSRRVSWDEFSQLVRDLHSMILLEQYLPDLVVGVGRSGGIVATMLAGCLGSRRVLVVDVEIDKEAGTRTLHPESKAALTSIPGEFKVLVAMADVLTGGSVKTVCGALPKTVERRVAALYRLPGASVEPDFLVRGGGPTPPEWPFRLVSTFGYRWFDWPGRAARL